MSHEALPVRNLQFWIDTNILLLLKDAPFNKRDAQLVLAAGSCADCPKRTGHNKLLFGDDLGRQGDQCTDPTCYQAKMNAHVAKSIATKPELVQISTAYSQQRDGSAVLPRNKYTVIRDDRPKSKDEAKRPEFKECKFTAEAIITEGTDVGTVHKVCANPSCTVHHPKQQSNRDDEKWKAEQEKQRRDQAIANTTGLRILTAVGAAVPVRLLKRDLLFLIERLVTVLDESRIETLARQHGIRQKRDDGGIAKTLTAYLRRADESTLSRMLVEATVLRFISAHKHKVTAFNGRTDLQSKLGDDFRGVETTWEVWISLADWYEQVTVRLPDHVTFASEVCTALFVPLKILTGLRLFSKRLFTLSIGFSTI
jgi:ParB family chromosome partitioning protein